MQQPQPPGKRPQETPEPTARAVVTRGLDKAAREINPFLAVVAIGLAILDFTCYAGLAATRRPFVQAMVNGATPATGSAAAAATAGSAQPGGVSDH